MSLYLVFRQGRPCDLLEAEDPETAGRQALELGSDASGVVSLDDPEVRAALLAHLHPIPAGAPAAAADGALRIWVDGSSRGNPGPAGWSYVRSDGRCDSGGLGITTNNVAELTAVLRALESLPARARARLYTDSRNVLGWLQGGWKRRDPRIRSLAEAIDRVWSDRGLQLEMDYVAGHAGEPGNEEAHRLATRAAEEQVAPAVQRA